ncbi:MAG: hypothetical protein AB8H79_07060 [Myxococcota bacterium]
MHPKVEELAARMKSVLDDVGAVQRAADEASDARREALRHGRQQLLQDLAAFAKAVGHLGASSGDGRVTLTWQDRSLTFVESGEGGVIRVLMPGFSADAETSPIRLFPHSGLPGSVSETYVVGVFHDGVEEVEPLFDAGLINLLAEGLGVPRPAPAPRAPQPGLDALVSED